MANKTIGQIVNVMTNPTTSDLIPIWNDAQQRTDVISRASLVGAIITGLGNIATGGYTLTVPANITAAGREAANVFVAAQTIQPSVTSDHALTLNMPASVSGDALRLQYNTTDRMRASVKSNDTLLSLAAFNNGASTGPRVYVGRNSNGSTPSGGLVLLEASNGVFYPLFFDTSGNLRTDPTGNVQPISTTATTVVVGTQSSALDTKNIIGEFTDYAGALAAILTAPLYDFTYKSGSFNGEQFTGIITDYSPEFGMDRDAAHPAGKSLNEVTAFGYLMAAIKEIDRRLAQLEARPG